MKHFRQDKNDVLYGKIIVSLLAGNEKSFVLAVGPLDSFGVRKFVLLAQGFFTK
jgi:hypothetical protein